MDWPDGLANHAVYVIVLGSFIAAFSNAAFANGGAMIVLAVTTTVLPVSAVVPIHSTLLIGSTVSRAIVFRDHIDWRITTAFLIGSVIAVVIAAPIYVSLSDETIALAIAVVMLVAIWLPGVSWRPKLRHPWVLVGFLHSFISTLFAYGAVLHAVILHTALKRREIVATMAASLTGMAVFKIVGYAASGFDYRPCVLAIALSIVAAFVGTLMGKLVIDRISETAFRVVFRLLVTITAVRLLMQGMSFG